MARQGVLQQGLVGGDRRGSDWAQQQEDWAQQQEALEGGEAAGQGVLRRRGGGAWGWQAGFGAPTTTPSALLFLFQASLFTSQ